MANLTQLSYTNTANVQHLITSINKSREVLTGLGKSYDDAFYVCALLRGLGPAFSSLSRDIIQRPLESLNFEDCSAQAEAEELAIQRNEAVTDTASAMKAGKAKEKNNTGSRAPQGYQQGQGHQQGPRKKCDHCKKPNHGVENCYTLHPELRPAWSRPTAAANATVAGDDDVSINEAGVQLSALQVSNLPQHVRDHLFDASAYNVTTVPDPAALGRAPLAGLRSASGTSPGSNGMFSWLIDSGATHSMTPYRHNFVNFTTATMRVKVANGDVTAAEGYGDVLIDLKQDGTPTPMLAKNVWFVPRLDTNLLSVAELAEDNVTIYFNAPSAPSLIFRQNAYLGLVQLSDRKYWLSTTGSEPETFQATLFKNNLATAHAVSGRKQLLSMRTWHRRLGHLGPQNLVHLKQVSTGIEFEDHFSANCPDCILANSTAKPHKGSTSSLSGKPYDLVHIDVWGPAPETSQDGNRYVLTILDDYTKTLRMYPMKAKSDSKGIFRALEAEVSTQFGYQIKAVRWDNEGEFVDHTLQNYLIKKGILSEPSTPYSPEQNGAAERAHRTIMIKVRAILAESHLPPTL